jgi:hypothetical protein
MGERVAVRALTFAGRRGTNISLMETGSSLDLMPIARYFLARPKGPMAYADRLTKYSLSVNRVWHRVTRSSTR